MHHIIAQFLRGLLCSGRLLDHHPAIVSFRPWTSQRSSGRAEA